MYPAIQVIPTFGTWLHGDIQWIGRQWDKPKNSDDENQRYDPFEPI
jgi:hypothetical protein